MKSFAEFLTESLKQYDFKIKIAGTLSDEQVDKMELALEKWGLVSITKPKVTPIQKHPQDFPNLTNTEVSIVDIVLDYPATPAEVSVRLCEVCHCLADQVRVYNGSDPVEAEREEALENEDEEYEVQLTAPYPKSEKNLPAGDKHTQKFLKDQKRKPSFKIAGGKTATASTTNDLPQGTASPIGSKKAR